MSAGLANAAFRAAGLGSRFLLSLYMARYMSVRDIGIFALLTGATGLIPAIAGLGLNYFVGRELVTLPRAEAIALLRDRIMFSVVMATLATLAVALMALTGLFDLPVAIGIAAAIIILETVALDLQMALIDRNRSAFANLLLLFRSGAWVMPFLIVAVAVPAARSIGTLCLFWLGGILCSHIILAFRIRADLPGLVRGLAVRGNRMVPLIPRAKAIYLSDLGQTGSLYIDRYLISALIGVPSAGIYFFFGSIANSVFTICLASTVQVASPAIRAAFVRGGISGADATMRRKVATTLAFGALALAAAWPAAWLVVRLVRNADLAAHIALLPILLLAYLIKLGSELVSTALAAAQADGHYALFNLLSLAAMVVLSVILIPPLGLLGVAVAFLGSSLLVAGLRLRTWRRMLRGVAA